MKTFAKFFTLASILAVAACASGERGGERIHNYERQAPYAHERTVGAPVEYAPVERPAERVYQARQVK